LTKLVLFEMKECEHCEKVRPYIEKLARERKISLKRVDVIEEKLEDYIPTVPVLCFIDKQGKMECAMGEDAILAFIKRIKVTVV